MLNTIDLLTVDDLSQSLKLYEHEIIVNCLNLETKQATFIIGDKFLRDKTTSQNMILQQSTKGFTALIIQK